MVDVGDVVFWGRGLFYGVDGDRKRVGLMIDESDLRLDVIFWVD